MDEITTTNWHVQANAEPLDLRTIEQQAADDAADLDRFRAFLKEIGQ
jgi:hypothetical protein